MDTNMEYGYYAPKKNQLLKEFRDISETVRPFLTERYGNPLAGRFIEATIDEYERLIPEIPFIRSFRGRFLNSFLIITAQELALFKAMSRYGKSPGEIWEVCHKALRIGSAKIKGWRKWIFRNILFSRITSMIFAKRGRKQIGNFEVEYLGGEGKEYNIGINYHRCGNIEFAIKHGGELFAPYICISDIALSDTLGWGLARTQTLADGCSHCDFRFIKDAPTRISSKTPAVQAVIEEIYSTELYKQSIKMTSN